MSDSEPAFARRAYSTRRAILDLQVAAQAADAYLIGVVGWRSWPDHDREGAARAAHRVLSGLLDRPCARPRWLVTEGVRGGVSVVTVEIARQRMLPTVGIASREVVGIGLAPVERLVVVGDRPEDAWTLFAHSCHTLWMIGGTRPAETQMRLGAGLGKPLVVVRGVGGRADALTARDLPTADFVEAADL